MQNVNDPKNFHYLAISGALGGWAGGSLYNISEDWRSAFSRNKSNFLGPRAFTASLITTNSILYSFYERLKNDKKITNMEAISLIIKKGPSPLFVALPEIAFKEAVFATAMLWAIAKTRKDNVENTKSLNLKDFSTLGGGLAAAIITQPIDKIAEIKQYSDRTLSTVDAFKQIIKKTIAR